MISNGISIDTIDSDTKNDDGFLAKERALHHGYIATHDVRSFVSNVLHRAGAHKIALLRVFGHGNVGIQAVGGGQRPAFWSQVIGVDAKGRLMNADLLSHLRGRFTTDAVVQLHGCDVAAQKSGLLFIGSLARLWHVRVQAAVAEQYARAGSQFVGKYIEDNGKYHFTHS